MGRQCRSGKPQWPGIGLIAVLFVTQAYAAFASAFGETLPRGLEILFSAIVISAAGLWLYADRPYHREVADQYLGFAALYCWELAIPVYLVETRGWKRALRPIGVALASYVCGYVVGWGLALAVG